VTGKQAADVAVLLCGQQLEIHRIGRDDEVIARLIVLETKFWECVQHDIEPAADGSESSARALRQIYLGNDTSLDFSQDEALCQTFRALAALKTERDEKEQLAEQLKQSIQQAMGDASRAIFAAGEVTYKRSKDGTALDTKQLAADHPDIAARYTVARPGSRRFVLSQTSDN
jgi:predicted phage-related endonuclease